MKDRVDLNRAATPRKKEKRSQKADTGKALRDGYTVLSRAEQSSVDDRKPLRPVVRQKQVPGAKNDPFSYLFED